MHAANSVFFDGLKQNSSIRELTFESGDYDYNDAETFDDVHYEILKVYQTNNNLTEFSIRNGYLHGGEHIMASVFRNSTNMTRIVLNNCDINDEQLLPMVEAIQGGPLKGLCLPRNRIGNTRCEAIVTLLGDQNCNIEILDLQENRITEEGAITLANGLPSNASLSTCFLWKQQVSIDTSRVVDAFARAFCDTTSINSIYASNHSVGNLLFGEERPDMINALTDMHCTNDKVFVATRKILQYVDHLDMEPLFELDAEEGEQNLNALPYVMAWFERAEEYDEFGKEEYCLAEKKLETIYQFAQAMPLLFVSVNPSIKRTKRKRA